MTKRFLLSLFLGVYSFFSLAKPPAYKALLVNHKIFGTSHAHFAIEDHQLNGQVFYIVSGHGGPDPGANTVLAGVSISEDEYAYDVSLRLAKNLIMHDARVYLIVRDENDGIRDEELLSMDTDETVWGNLEIPINQADRLKQRTQVINQLYDENLRKGFSTQRVIETHVDSRYTNTKVDIFFYYNQNKPESKQLAASMLETIKEKYEEKQKGRGYLGEIKPRNLWMITQSKPPVVFVELGNITNEADRRRLLKADNRQAIANWFTEGIIKDSNAEHRTVKSPAKDSTKTKKT
jgi:N-acetylmuramoyl-L-alanine amidase